MDQELSNLINAEIVRQARTLSPIASESMVSDDVLDARESAITNKMVERPPGHRFYAGAEIIDEIECLVPRRAQSLFSAVDVNVQCHSGTQAKQADSVALARPRSTLLSMSLTHAGHVSHNLTASATGKLFKPEHYGVHPGTGILDVEDLRRRASAVRPPMLRADASAYVRDIDYRAFSDIAHRVGAHLLIDVAHFAGLIAAGLLRNRSQSAAAQLPV